ncbi:MAG: protein phosphatase 2C domain-containing protein [Gammaproteobacteria bacterium]|nr:protein phosphatase 2C domain-containing protein [Gammaproteobacteria bacterium]MDH3560626.1 protein phosphatase 2C domain-containing protein [Gammaproteobacteria bacterium]
MNQPLIYCATDMDDIVSLAFASGKACAYTRRAPEKTTPNEDSVALIPCDSGAGILVIADGMGGSRAGDQASREAVNALAEAAGNNCDNTDALRDAILNGVEQANTRIGAMNLGAATTVAIVALQDNEARPYHIGDSMTLIIGQRGKLKYQSTPHSPVGYAVEAGLLDADDAIYHEERHLISNAVGMPGMHVEMGPRVALAARDTVLVASDGLFDNLQVDEIIATIRKGPLPDAAAQLARHCHQRMTRAGDEQPHKPDDMSFILYRRS